MLRHDHPQTSATYAAAELWNCDWQRSRPSGARCNRVGDGNRRTRTGALRVQTRAQDVDARAGGVAPTAVMLWKKKSTEFFADDDSAAQFAYPQWRESFRQSSSRASSPPAHPMKDSPTGQPASDPMGRVSWGSPLRPAMQVRRMTRTRNDSSASDGVFNSGATQGAVGSARMVPGCAIARM